MAGALRPAAAELRALTSDEAREIYRVMYWEAAECDAWPPALALVMFDGSVNHGAGAMVRMLQEALRTDGRTDPGPVDGVPGPRTGAAVARAAALPGGVWPLVLDLIARRATLYMRLCAADSTQRKFARGWGRRVVALVETARAVAGE